MDLQTFEKAEKIVDRMKKVRCDYEKFLDIVPSSPSGHIAIDTNKGYLTLTDSTISKRIVAAIEAVYKEELEKLKSDLDKL